MPEYNFKCVLIGSQTLLTQCAEELLKKGHEISAVITDDPSAIKWTKDNNVKHIDQTDELYQELHEIPFDYLFSIINFKIIPNEVLALPRMFSINFHDGPLPEYAGRNVTSWAILNHEKKHGITWHLMTAEVDKGDILKSVSFPIGEDETALTLNSKCYEAAMSSFGELITELESGVITPIKQLSPPIHYYQNHQCPEASCAISWEKPAEDISALVRALTFGPYANPMGLPKLVIGRDIVYVDKIEVLSTPSVSVPGTITHIGDDQLIIATQTKDISIRSVRTSKGNPISINHFIEKYELQENFLLVDPREETKQHLSELNDATEKHEDYWRGELIQLTPVETPYANQTGHLGSAVDYKEIPFNIPSTAKEYLQGESNPKILMLSAFSAYLSRIVGRSYFHIGLCYSELNEATKHVDNIFATQVPMAFSIDLTKTFDEYAQQVSLGYSNILKRKTYSRDIFLRYPELNKYRDTVPGNFPVSVELTEGAGIKEATPYALELKLSDNIEQCSWVYDPRVYSDNSISRIQEQFSIFINEIAKNSTMLLGEIPLLSSEERHQLLTKWNQTSRDIPSDACIHQLFEQQTELTPDSTAIVFRATSLTYRELNEQANQLANYIKKIGVTPGTIVGICLERSLDMIIGILAVQKAGGAYLPLDPSYPKERLSYMLEDSNTSIVLTQQHLIEVLENPELQTISIDTIKEKVAQEDTDNSLETISPDSLAYVIYTSGSTGKPKGVLVEHRNVVNFFTGMDERISGDEPGVWLAVTSLSFDISVLELFWTLARGFKVVIYSDAHTNAPNPVISTKYPEQKIDFSLFYWNLAEKDELEEERDKYKLLLESAKYADDNDFSAVWTPERHFHAFGGLYPNPSVVSAAIAVTTKNIRIRAGSCVLPLHHPIRVAEEWSVVDNLSNGRVDLGIAAGWMPNDFVLKPENHANNKQVMLESVETLRKLWRGEKVTFSGPKGDVEVQTLPRPIQPELPICITAAGNPETFEMAARLGANILTHLLGQTVEQVGEKLALYRRVWKECGHPGEGHITLMLHTLVSDDEHFVRQTAREPMKTYLKSAAGLVKQAAWHFPTFKEKSAEEGQTLDDFFDSASPEDMDALLNFAVDRYYNTSGLFGTPEGCIEIVDKLKEIGVDEIGCLIDFGIPTNTVLNKLPYLNQLRQLAKGQPKAEMADRRDYSIPGLVKRHSVTHLQCTPSMAKMLVADSASREALSKLNYMMVGGEALSRKLATEIKTTLPGKLVNMYGPTETTIWSATYEVDKVGSPIPIGKPIANTALFILDEQLQPVPIGIPGELYIGGNGVVRGYLNRPELTSERFLAPPFPFDYHQRLYKTGDMARRLPDGNVEFLGRFDHQVKIRGHRVEIGEIETLLHSHPALQDAVITVHKDDSENNSLVAYLVPKSPTMKVSVEDLRDYLKSQLPDYMLPSMFVSLNEMPLTFNGKIDRAALPEPDENKLSIQSDYVAPRSDTEAKLAKRWETLLRADRIGINEHFFEIGGDSLLAVQLAVSITEDFGISLPLQSVFQSPNIADLAKRIEFEMETGTDQ